MRGVLTLTVYQQTYNYWTRYAQCDVCGELSRASFVRVLRVRLCGYVYIHMYLYVHVYVYVLCVRYVCVVLCVCGIFSLLCAVF